MIIIVIIVVVVVERVAQTKLSTTPPNLQLHHATQSLSLIKFTTFKVFCHRPSLNRLPDACLQRNGAKHAPERRDVLLRDELAAAEHQTLGILGQGAPLALLSGSFVSLGSI